MLLSFVKGSANPSHCTWRKKINMIWLTETLTFTPCPQHIASITAMIYFHIILQPAVHIYDFYIFMPVNFNKNTLIQSLFLCCKIYTYTYTWSIKLSDYLSFNLVAFFSANLYGSNTNCTRPIFKQSNIPLYQSLRVFVNKQ